MARPDAAYAVANFCQTSSTIGRNIKPPDIVRQERAEGLPGAEADPKGKAGKKTAKTEKFRYPQKIYLFREFSEKKSYSEALLKF